MKRLMLVAALASSATTFAAVTVRYHNGDSSRHTFNAVCKGAKATLVTDGRTTGTATIQGSGPCTVKHAGGEVELTGGETLDIKGGTTVVK
jgi:hypothetical protein